MPQPVHHQSLFTNYTVEQVINLNYTDILGSGLTKGCSNKSYSLEIWAEKNGSRAQLYSLWGPTGGTQREEWRHYNSLAEAQKEFNSIVKSKKKKGYVEVDVAKRAIGSEEAKKIVKAVVFANADTQDHKVKSTLHPKVQQLVHRLFKSTNDFVVATLKCPLGQLTNQQVDLGKNILEEAKETLKHEKDYNKPDYDKQLETITNKFYAAIPHNLGSGYRGVMSHLLLDSKIKIAKKEEDLETLLDAKQVGAILTSDDTDQQYLSLKTDIEYIDDGEYVFKWINALIHGTIASNHHYLKNMKLVNAWKMARCNEEDIFLSNAGNIAKECGKQILPKQIGKYVAERPPLSSDVQKLYKQANVLPLCHGTRTENLIGITQKGFLIRPSGVILCGSAYGDSIYFGYFSKSAGYSSISNSYWARGNDKTGFVFLCDVALGNQKIADHFRNYTRENIRPCHSVWAKGGQSGVINDEFMVYNGAGPKQQHKINYLLEVQS